jgi:hypothetical protein
MRAFPSDQYRDNSLHLVSRLSTASSLRPCRAQHVTCTANSRSSLFPMPRTEDLGARTIRSLATTRSRSRSRFDSSRVDVVVQMAARGVPKRCVALVWIGRVGRVVPETHIASETQETRKGTQDPQEPQKKERHIRASRVDSRSPWRGYNFRSDEIIG